MRTLRLIVLVLIMLGVVSTLWLSGVWKAGWTGLWGAGWMCAPFLVFAWAAMLGKRRFSEIWTIVALTVAIAYGAYSYYDALWIYSSGEVGALAPLIIPIVQVFIGLVPLIVAFVDRSSFKAERP